MIRKPHILVFCFKQIQREKFSATLPGDVQVTLTDFLATT